MFFPFSLSIPQKVTKVNQELMAQRDKRYTQFFIMRGSCPLLDALSYVLSFFSFLQGEPGRKGQRGLIGLPGQKVENVMRLLLAAYHLFWIFLCHRQETIIIA